MKPVSILSIYSTFVMNVIYVMKIYSLVGQLIVDLLQN